MANRLRAPQSSPTTVSCKSATKATGAASGRQPYGRRGSGTCSSAAANEPGGLGGAGGTPCRTMCFIDGAPFSPPGDGGSTLLLFSPGEKALAGWNLAPTVPLPS